MAVTALTLTSVVLFALLVLVCIELVEQRNRADAAEVAAQGSELDYQDALRWVEAEAKRADQNREAHVLACVAHVQSDLDHQKAIKLLHDELTRIEGEQAA